MYTIQAILPDLFYQGIFCRICDFTLWLFSTMLYRVISYLQHGERKSETVNQQIMLYDILSPRPPPQVEK